MAGACDPLPIDETVHVKQVIDGDTVRLEDQRLIRIVGINTPEIDHQRHQSEPLADQARDKLVRLLGSDRRLHLSYGAEKKDRHGRWLAHVTSMTDKNIQRELLLQGLAFWIVVPPNTRAMDCYQAAEQFARNHGLGIWGKSYYLPKTIAQVDLNKQGFHYLTGIVQRVGYSKKSIWLNLADAMTPSLKRHKVALRINRSDLHYFYQSGTSPAESIKSNDQVSAQDPHMFDNWVGRRINARGWSYINEQQLVILVKHPAALEAVH